MEFGYWKIKGRCHHIRYLIAYLKAKYIEFNPRSAEEWKQSKKKLKKYNPFINLPYCTDGNFVVSEAQAVSLAIIMRAGRRELLGKTGYDVIHHRTLQEYIHDIREFALGLVEHTKDEIKAQFEEYAKAKIGFKLQALKKFMGERKFLLGYLTLADFELCYVIEFLDWVCRRCGVRNPFVHFENLSGLVMRVRALDGVKQFCKGPLDRIPWMLPSTVKFD